MGRKFTIFALFYFVFEGKFQVQAPRGAYIIILLLKICTLSGRLTCFYRTDWLLGLVHTYPDIFENGDFFFAFFFEKYASKCSLLDSFLSVHMKARKRWTYDSILFRACAMTSSHSKTFVYVRPHENDKPAFTKTPLWGPFENPRFWYPKTPFTYGRKVERGKKSLFSKISRDVRTQPRPRAFPLKKMGGREKPYGRGW